MSLQLSVSVAWWLRVASYNITAVIARRRVKQRLLDFQTKLGYVQVRHHDFRM